VGDVDARAVRAIDRSERPARIVPERNVGSGSGQADALQSSVRFVVVELKVVPVRTLDDEQLVVGTVLVAGFTERALLGAFFTRADAGRCARLQQIGAVFVMSRWMALPTAALLWLVVCPSPVVTSNVAERKPGVAVNASVNPLGSVLKRAVRSV